MSLFCLRARKKAKSNKVYKILGRKKGDKYTLKTAFSEDAIKGHVLKVHFSSPTRNRCQPPPPFSIITTLFQLQAMDSFTKWSWLPSAFLPPLAEVAGETMHCWVPAVLAYPSGALRSPSTETLFHEAARLQRIKMNDFILTLVDAALLKTIHHYS